MGLDLNVWDCLPRTTPTNHAHEVLLCFGATTAAKRVFELNVWGFSQGSGESANEGGPHEADDDDNEGLPRQADLVGDLDALGNVTPKIKPFSVQAAAAAAATAESREGSVSREGASTRRYSPPHSWRHKRGLSVFFRARD